MERRAAIAALSSSLSLIAMLSCSSPARPDPVEEPSGPNTLTSVERAAGWRLLFDGRTTAGWRGFKQTSMPAGWQVVDAALTRVGAGGDIISIDQFGDFELTLEWMIAPGGNSGIMFRVSEVADATYLTGPEYQIVDNVGSPDGRNPLSSAGACYGHYPPSQDATRPAGSWNEARIVVVGSHVEHWMNGTKIVEYEIGSADWLARVQAGPFANVPTYGREARGSIALQDHGDRVAYRSIKVRSR